MKAFDIEQYREQLTNAIEESIDYWYKPEMDYGDLIECVSGDSTVCDVAVFGEDDEWFLFGEVFDDVVTVMGIKSALLNGGIK